MPFCIPICYIGNIGNEHLVITLHFRGMKDTANVREMIYAFAQMGADIGKMADSSGRLVLPDVQEMEAIGAYVKLG